MLGVLNRILRTLNAGNRTLLKATSEPELLHEMCSVIVETGGYSFASVGYAEHDEHKRVRWLAGVGIETAVLEALHFTWADAELGQGATATAIRTGEPVVGKLLLTDPGYAGPAYAVVRKISRQMGHVAMTAVPLRVDGKVLGALAIASSEANAFDAAEVELLSKLADDLVFGITSVRTSELHRAGEATIARLAYFDPPTGLPNRTFLLEALEAAVEAARQRNGTLALFLYANRKQDQVGAYRHAQHVVAKHIVVTQSLRDLGNRIIAGCRAGQRTLKVSELLQCSRSTARNYITDLVDAGVITPSVRMPNVSGDDHAHYG